MDRLLYIAMSGARETMRAQAVNTNNMANASTTGFQAELQGFRSLPVDGPGLPSRVYGVAQGGGIDFTPGNVVYTGRDLDVAVDGEGWLAIQAPDGNEAFTRAGDLFLREYRPQAQTRLVLSVQGPRNRQEQRAGRLEQSRNSRADRGYHCSGHSGFQCR